MFRLRLLSSSLKTYSKQANFRFETTLASAAINSKEINLNETENSRKIPIVTIPRYKFKSDESLKSQKARLVYQSRKRGMLENDLLLSTFAALYLDKMNEKQVSLYDKLINIPDNDWDIYDWIIGKKVAPSEFQSEVLDMLIDHAKNKEGVMRIQQPSLY